LFAGGEIGGEKSFHALKNRRRCENFFFGRPDLKFSSSLFFMMHADVGRCRAARVGLSEIRGARAAKG
jgi:hypothetical protein